MTLSAAISWNDKYTALYQWAFGVSGWAVRWADQNAPRPDYPYILLDVTNTTRTGGTPEVTRSLDLTRARDVKVTPVAQNNTLYRLTINGTDFDFTSDADATVAEITLGLAAAVAAGAEPVSATDHGTYLDIVGDGEVLNPATPRLFTLVTTGPLTWTNNDAGNEVAQKTSSVLELTLNVQAFHRNTAADNPATDPGRNAYNALTTLCASLGLPSVQAALRAADLAVIQELPIIDLSEVAEDSFISRASMDIRLRTLSVLTEYVGYIAQVSGSSQYTDGVTTINDTYLVE